MERSMEQNWIRRTAMAAALVVGALSLEACSWQDLNPAESNTHGASGGAANEVLLNFPGATDINVTHANDNPNYLSWRMPDGSFCTAFASQTQNRGQTPGRLVSQPYCRKDKVR